METYPEQFPDESRPEPSRRAEDRVFDTIQGDRPPRLHPMVTRRWAASDPERPRKSGSFTE